MGIVKNITAALLTAGIAILSCKKDKGPAMGIDEEMLEMARPATGFTWYKNSPSLLGKSTGSGHNYAFLRTRFNGVAATMLDGARKVKEGSIFPEGSLIVKELTNGSEPERYAILLKRSSHPDADERGWVWGYINANGTVAEPASKKGDICKGCHNQAGNIDYILMNKFFP
jgi:hypothetical protein